MANSVNSVSSSLCSCPLYSANGIIVSDASVLLRDIAGDAAQKSATMINPPEDRLNQIDEPAADNTWHDAPNLSPGNLKAQARDHYNKQKPFSRSDIQNAKGDATQNAHPDGSRDPADAAKLEADSRNQGTGSGMDPHAGANAATGNLRGTASDNIPDETKDKARDSKNRTTDYMRTKVPKERREQTIFRLKKMIVEIQSHSDCECFTSNQVAGTYTMLIPLQISKLLRLSYHSPKSMEDTARTSPSRVLEALKVPTATLH